MGEVIKIRKEPEVIESIQTGTLKNKRTGKFEPVYKDIYEPDNCQVEIGISRDGTPIICGDRAGYRCDRCLAWVCHFHFGTYGGGRLHICDECKFVFIKESKERIKKLEAVNDAQI